MCLGNGLPSFGLPLKGIEINLAANHTYLNCWLCRLLNPYSITILIRSNSGCNLRFSYDYNFMVWSNWPPTKNAISGKKTQSRNANDCLLAIWCEDNQTCHFVSKFAYVVTQYNQETSYTTVSWSNTQPRVSGNQFVSLGKSLKIYCTFDEIHINLT